MKVLIFIVASLIVSTKQCSKKTVNGAIPSCVERKIDSIKMQAKWNPPAQVDEYFYNGKTVYLFSADCCDQYNTVFDADCNYICAPSGGLTGSGDRKCEDFNATAKHIKLVWKDDR
jgi:hypothetical protein